MKKLILGILIGVIALSFSGFMVMVKAVAPQGEGKANVPDLEKIEFIHYKRNFSKPIAAKAPKAPSCYKFLSPRKVKWQTLPVNYFINPQNSRLDNVFIANAIFTSAEVWDAEIKDKLIGNYDINNNVQYGVQDYKNAITFGDYQNVDVIAVTTIWYNSALRTIAEFDMMFDTDFDWGDATVDLNKMDLQNIATHELGHAIGLGDVYEVGCSEVTMYGYSTKGEITKRDLEIPDITGLRILYP